LVGANVKHPEDTTQALQPTFINTSCEYFATNYGDPRIALVTPFSGGELELAGSDRG
jgi:hypothetical protein